MLFELILKKSSVDDDNAHTKVHKVIISSENSFKEIFDSVGLSVFKNREHLNSIYKDTTFFGRHIPGFFGCFRDFIHFLEPDELGKEQFHFFLISCPKESDMKAFQEFVTTLVLHKTIEEFFDVIKIFVDESLIRSLFQEIDD